MTAKPSRLQRPVLLTVPEAAGRLGVSRAQTYRWIESGALAHVSYPQGNGSPGGPVRVTEADVEAFIAAHRQEAS